MTTHQDVSKEWQGLIQENEQTKLWDYGFDLSWPVPSVQKAQSYVDAENNLVAKWKADPKYKEGDKLNVFSKDRRLIKTIQFP